MAGSKPPPLIFNGFLETDTFEWSKADLQKLFGLSDRAVDDRLEALMWSLHRNPTANCERVSERNLWVAVTPGGVPPIRIYMRPHPTLIGEWDLLWIEERP